MESTYTSWSRYAGAAFAGLPCLYLSYVLINVWLDPLAWDEGRWIPFGVGLLVLEFIVLHSGGFIGAMVSQREHFPKRFKYFAGLLVMYSLMALGFAAAMDTYKLMAVFAAVMVGRFMTIVSVAPDSPDRHALTHRSALGIVVYLVVAFGTIVYQVPPMGITTEILDEVYPSRGSGLWEQHPAGPIVGGAVYFAIMGLAELLIFSRMPRSK